MNGWRRLFVVVALIVSVPAAALWWINKPLEKDELRNLYACEFAAAPESMEQLRQTDLRYKELLASGKPADRLVAKYMPQADADCAERMSKILDGRAFAESSANWWQDFRNGLLALSVFLGSIYAIGFGLGWVWRGFRPKKPQ